MSFIAKNYATNPSAPVDRWTCAPTSTLGPFAAVPLVANRKGLDLCGQCVSYVKKVCPELPETGKWRKGARVKEAKDLAEGTVIATFNSRGQYQGHAAIYVRNEESGIVVYDQYVTGKDPRGVHKRILRWAAIGTSNDGNLFHVVEL
jgi:hypothetical protein